MSGENFGVRWLDTALVAGVILRDFAHVVGWPDRKSASSRRTAKSFFSTLLAPSEMSFLIRFAENEKAS
jgi:hypothetical protein